MGNSNSVEDTEADPWWQQSVLTNHNESQQPMNTESEMTHSRESTGHRSDVRALWHRREHALGQTIQHLAEENMRISAAKQIVEKSLHLFEAEAQNSTEELERLRSEAEKSKQVLEKLHAQIQSGREDRQMITSEMERIRSGFDAERETNEQLMSKIRTMREEQEQSKRSVEFLNEQLKQKTLLVEKTMISFNQERKERECLAKEVEKLRDELKSAKSYLDTITDAGKEQHRPQGRGSDAAEEGAGTRVRSPEAVAEMERFQAEMSTRREARQRAMQAVSSEMERLRVELNSEREARQQLEETLIKSGKSKQEEALALELEQAQQKTLSDKKRIKQISDENNRLQFELDNGRQVLVEKDDEIEKMQSQFNTEREQTKNQILALKEVANICKEMLSIREGQVLHLKNKLKQIETSVTNNTHDKLSIDLRSEYETQMENIRTLKNLYEERMKLMLSEKEKLVQDSEEKSQLLDAEIKKSAKFEQELADTKLSLEEKEEHNSNLQIQLDDSHDKSHGLAKELTLINNLFTQMLTGTTATDMDLDRLTRLLQENHDLITDITIKEDSSEVAAALPKLLLDLVNQVDSGITSPSSSPTGERNDDTPQTCASATTDDSSTSHIKTSNEESVNGIAVEDIALNLPKVWKVLMELLSHHVPPSSVSDQEKKDSCYKSIDTPSGPRLVISVSQTFLRLKDLILEKKSLNKELTHLKQLNGHLERKLNDQEHKLSMVSTELRKTWNVVDQMQTQHQKLHTHEKILRYELHEKRKMLNELKQELEYCREKWERARQKNSQSEEEWKKLRKEFASRKKNPNDILNNSGESGFLDERGEDSCEDEDSSAKDTGQLDPGIEDTCTSDTSSPQDTVEHQSEIMLNLDSESLPNNESSNIEENCSEGMFNVENQLEQTNLCLNSDDTQYEDISDCRIDSPSNNCSTISIITMLKQQLSFFSTNLNCISNSDNDITGEHLEALQSIFSLPPIQIPIEISNKITIQNCFENYCLEQDNACSISTANDFTFDGESEKTNNSPSTQNEVNKPNNANLESSVFEESSSRAVESQTQSARLNRTPEEIAEARAERLKRLEEQCQQLYNKVTRTTHRSTALCNRLEELHEQFRTSESPPRYRNNSNRSPLNCIPGTPPFVSSSENPSPSTSPLPRLQSDMCQLPNVPVPPPLPHHLLTVRIPTCHELPEVPRPPPLPAVLPSTRIPTASILRGTNQLDSSNSVNETTRHETQSQQQQDLDSTDTSTEDHVN